MLPTIQAISHEKLLMDSLSCEDTLLMHNTMDVGKRFVGTARDLKKTGIKSLATTYDDVEVCQYSISSSTRCFAVLPEETILNVHTNGFDFVVGRVPFL